MQHTDATLTPEQLSRAMAEIGRKGGRARQASMTSDQRRAFAASGGRAGRGKPRPKRKPRKP
jgi:general stress protein YciG